MTYKGYTRLQLVRGATTSPWTTNFRHMLPFPKKWLKRFSIRDPVIKSVRPKDRIQYWNVVPGDQVRLLGDKTNTLHEVLSINKVSNRVFVKGTVTGEQDKVVSNKNYHYSRCQLFLGNYEFPPQSGSSEAQVTPVFAKRLGTTAPFWNPFLQRFDWQRFATSTAPRLPNFNGEQLPIPWPQPPRIRIPEPTNTDATHDVVAQVTYQPPKFSPSIDGPLPHASEDAFLASIVNLHLRDTIDESAPVEPFLHKELSNPHSKAKKLRRFKEYKIRTKALLKETLAYELRNLNGRKPQEARAEALFKWRAQLKTERDEKKKMRWKHKSEVANLERKAARKVRKEVQQRRRLTEMVLGEGSNQVIPKDI
ncbi:hypothetical protein P691DRAFT_722468 [Macrolepiota fuliginosa MF-IS2]|uniref:KOW domain-containing protein n=1 Tax=Macrolepiota fuliginosa MF-IS2 TaxID=1400762 RepID=A0A9P6C4S8_9AGAR|nr:hypothetical protein P691DRAFT_722468 [Macrolepiota fuliginosa MF-IS2]